MIKGIGGGKIANGVGFETGNGFGMSAGETVSAMLRAEQAYCGQLCAAESLEFGVAYGSSQFGALVEGVQFRDVTACGGGEAARAVAEARAHFESRRLSCHVYAPAVGAETDGLAEVLTGQGFERRGVLAMRLTDLVESAGGSACRVLPARAMRRALGAVVASQYDEAPASVRAVLAEAVGERLNDARMEGFVAVKDGRAVGRCGLFQVGEIGRVCGPYVVSDGRGCGTGRALVGQVVKLARRLMLRVVCVPLRGGEAEAAGFFERCGFSRAGETCEFVRADEPEYWT